jgi:hypothetical protein
LYDRHDTTEELSDDGGTWRQGIQLTNMRYKVRLTAPCFALNNSADGYVSFNVDVEFFLLHHFFTDNPDFLCRLLQSLAELIFVFCTFMLG